MSSAAAASSPGSPSSSKSSTPGGDLTHSTYEVNVPVRNGRTSSPHAERPSIRIPKIHPVNSPNQPTPAELAVGLEGKYVDEFGNVLDWDGTVLARVQGDLPSMVGRPVSVSGEIFDIEGDVAGHVCEAYPKSDPDPESKPDLKPLSGGLKVDDDGNIFDEAGHIIGKLNNPPASGGGHDDGRNKEQVNGGNRVAPKPPAAPRPDEMYLDVKSTFDGIQLIIKIPTIFNNGANYNNTSHTNNSRVTDNNDGNVSNSN